MNAQRPDVTAIVLAGGKGTRMDSDLARVGLAGGEAHPR
jgi:bifunctional N-acetylglucosamine-1-phosphate-uridyltransferase/glucosamine-1-phosphate-acetyltransferase GlmU-like protein